MKKLKKIKLKDLNLWHLLWLLGVYAILIVILVMIIEYKVKWEHRDLNTYLYFYNCSNNVCTTTIPVHDYYSSIKCDSHECPYIKEKENNLVILTLHDKDYVYDYYEGQKVNDKYDSYSFSTNSFIVKDKNEKYGIITREGKTLVETKYNRITDYREHIYVYYENSKAGIAKADNSVNIKPTYEEAMILNEKYYAYLEDGHYYIASFVTELPILDEKFDYIYITDNTLITIKDKKIDILDGELRSRLILKLDTYYAYKTEKERNSLNITRLGDMLYFSVVQEENKMVNYVYDIKNGKLL